MGGVVFNKMGKGERALPLQLLLFATSYQNNLFLQYLRDLCPSPLFFSCVMPRAGGEGTDQSELWELGPPTGPGTDVRIAELLGNLGWNQEKDWGHCWGPAGAPAGGPEVAVYVISHGGWVSQLVGKKDSSAQLVENKGSSVSSSPLASPQRPHVSSPCASGLLLLGSSPWYPVYL